MSKTALAIVIIFFITTGVFLLAIIIINLYIKKITQHKQIIFDRELEFQKTLTTSILETQEQLLKSISQDLHDDAGQQLTVINFQLENLKLDFSKNRLEPVSESVTNLSKTLRQISHALNTNLLDNKGLIAAIKADLERLQKNKTIQIILKIDDENNKVFPNEDQIVLFRIFQEIVNNTLKHAKASMIKVTLKTTPFCELKFEDNGIGFDQESIQNKNTLGLSTIQKRASLIKYAVSIIGIPNTGTTITITEENQAKH